MADDRSYEGRGGGSFRGRRHLACVRPGSRRRSAAQVGGPALANDNAYTCVTWPLRIKSSENNGAAEEGPTEPLLFCRWTSDSKS